MHALDDGTLDQAQQLGMRPMIWSPLGGGRLFRGNDAQAVRVRDEMTAIAARSASAWPRWPTPGSCVIPRALTRSPAAAASKACARRSAALDMRLDAEDWYAIWVASKGHAVP